jgi:hypothetical protein
MSRDFGRITFCIWGTKKRQGLIALSDCQHQENNPHTIQARDGTSKWMDLHGKKGAPCEKKAVRKRSKVERPRDGYMIVNLAYGVNSIFNSVSGRRRQGKTFV